MSTKRALGRRDFLKLAAAGTCGCAIHDAFSPLGGMLAFADPQPAYMGGGSTMILVNMSGGCSYNLAPIYNATYYSKNPTISYNPTNSVALTADQGLHPAFAALRTVWDEGHLALLNLVGYPNANRSHAESTDIWFAGARYVAPALSGGWAARMTCQLAGNFFGGVSLAGSNLLIQGECNPPRNIGDLNNLGESSFWGGDSGTQQLKDVRDAVLYAADAPSNEKADFVTTSMVNLQTSLTTIRNATSNITLPVTFPNTGFGSQCRDAARLIAAPALGTRFIYMELGGFDTHAGERTGLNNRLTELSGGLNALVNCLKALGKWNTTSIITMSEFSRTFENGSQGTDHGHAAPMLVLGGSVNGGIKTPTPTTAELNAANGYFHQYHVDFRQVFKETIASMGMDPGAVFPEAIPNTAYSSLGLY